MASTLPEVFDFLFSNISPVGADLRLIAHDISPSRVLARREPAIKAICLGSQNKEGKTFVFIGSGQKAGKNQFWLEHS